MDPTPVQVPPYPGEHALQSKFCFWFMQRDANSRTAQAAEEYEKSIKPIAAFETVEGFFKVYNYLVKPSSITVSTEIHLFRNMIKPIWEARDNQRGGKVILRLVKGLTNLIWEQLLIALVGDQFEVGDEITGIVLSIRAHEDVISIWNRTADDTHLVNRIRDGLKRVLDLPGFVRLEYKSHAKGMRSRGGNGEHRGDHHRGSHNSHNSDRSHGERPPLPGSQPGPSVPSAGPGSSRGGGGSGWRI
ncbi:Eukaryotic translation initiation factor 4E [Hondaea fermentalgiana]|uniref:Eukaryotic translation initiation factor 4E n=1 Tax=Hondaea fermentalgiana TaxID=2315210 RepID=A0A2R5G8X4_9STRA|nr:Eukaryotic translation initiation factor 4E [Hondaea fermentalgiana]|eukprot:GBG26995.1 Eukaryotic translation initiation factor 4E [Hondaea fermentalgiana]